MDPRDAAFNYLKEGRVMQLATLHHGEQPRASSVYYVASADLKWVYWLSEPRRRHSQDLRDNPRVGGAIAVKTDIPVAGLQFTGEAKEVTDIDEIKAVLTRYNEKYGDPHPGLYERIVAGTNKHKVYRIDVREMELFDEVNFPGGEVVPVTF